MIGAAVGKGTVMRSSDIPRDATVDAADGEVGRVRHVVVVPLTYAVTDLVVVQGVRQWRLQASAIAGVAGERVRLQGERSRLQPGSAFTAEEFTSLAGTDEQGDSQSTFELHRRPRRLQLREEVLRVTKTEEQTGVARLSTRVTERLETVTVPVRATRLVIEVVPGSGSARVGDRVLHEGESLEVLLSEERVRVTKEVVVREDVLIRTETVEHEEQIQETLRREELVVDQEGDLAVEEASRRQR